MKPLMLETSNLYLDTAYKLAQSWWLMWMNLFTPQFRKPKEDPQTLVIVMPVFLNWRY